jgi:non-canonical (house-cleaning) NTP pyrophosphatase
MTNQKFIFILNSNSQLKEEAIKEILNSFLTKKDYALIKHNLPINFPDTPFNKETYLGAKLRAKKLRDFYKKNSTQKRKIFIGLESGLVKRFTAYFEEVWCCVIFSGQYFFGYSSGYQLPKKIIEKITTETHVNLLKKLEKETKISSKDTWGNYSNGLLSRKEGLKEAFRNTLVALITEIKNI